MGLNRYYCLVYLICISLHLDYLTGLFLNIYLHMYILVMIVGVFCYFSFLPALLNGISLFNIEWGFSEGFVFPVPGSISAADWLLC